MKKLLSCAFNMDSGCVELKFNDGSMIAINCTAVENEVADNMYQRSELDYLIYNDPLAYADRLAIQKWLFQNRPRYQLNKHKSAARLRITWFPQGENQY